MSRNKLSAGVYEKWMGKEEYKNGAASHIMRLAMLLFAFFLRLFNGIVVSIFFVSLPREYPPTDCTDFHRLGGYGIPAIPTQPPNYLPTEFAEHTETTGGEEKSVYICEICGRIFSA